MSVKAPGPSQILPSLPAAVTVEIPTKEQLLSKVIVASAPPAEKVKAAVMAVAIFVDNAIKRQLIKSTHVTPAVFKILKNVGLEEAPFPVWKIQFSKTVYPNPVEGGARVTTGVTWFFAMVAAPIVQFLK